ncbi:MAG: FliG C-terminal domain-containing protein [Treponemataceae bacterium]
MRLQIIDIGNSKGIRIPQAILKQVSFGEEVEMDVSEGKITLRRSFNPAIVPDFSSLPEMDDETIQRALRKISGTDLITALVGADARVKQAVYRNLNDRVRAYVIPKVEKLEKGDAKDLIIERSRNMMSEALMEILKE